MRVLPSYFEDFRSGDRFTSEPRLVTDADLQHMIEASGDRHRLHTDAAYAREAGFERPLLHGPFGIAAFLGWFTGSGIAADTVLAMLDSNWRYLGPITVGDALSFEMTITRCRRSGKGDRGIVGRHELNISRPDGRVKKLTTTNNLLRPNSPFFLPHCIGMKTGFTNLAGKCLISAANYRGRTVICVMLGSSSKFIWRESGALLNWGLGLR